MRRASTWLLLLGVLGGCASTPSSLGSFSLDAGVVPESVGRTYPPPHYGEPARYALVGQFIGERNFTPETRERSTLAALLAWLTGIDAASPRPAELVRPHGAATVGGRIYVADLGQRALFVVDTEQGQLDVWRKADGLLDWAAPVAVVPGPADTVFVSDADLKAVFHFDRNGRTLGVFGRGQLKRPTGLAYDAATGRLYVADTHAHDIKVYAPGGGQVGRFGGRGGGAGEFNYPTFLALRDGELYVSDTMNSRVQVLAADDGRALRQVGRRGLSVGDLVRPKGIALDSQANLYVVESYYDQLLVFDRQGRFLMPIGGGAGRALGQYYLPSAVFVDDTDRVWLTDSFNGRVVVYQFLGAGHGP
jgi:DNA-binding beta-propeller fold protein YncE